MQNAVNQNKKTRIKFVVLLLVTCFVSVTTEVTNW